MTGVTNVIPGDPATPDWAKVQDRYGADLTDRQTAALTEYLVHGNYQAAADCSGLKYQTIKNQVSSAIIRTGARSAVQIPYLLGWLHIPERWVHP